LVPDERIVRICVEGRPEEGFNTVEVEVVGSDGWIKPGQFVEEGSSARRMEQTGGRKELDG
jgi:hypothetical protein